MILERKSRFRDNNDDQKLGEIERISESFEKQKARQSAGPMCLCKRLLGLRPNIASDSLVRPATLLQNGLTFRGVRRKEMISALIVEMK